MKRSDQEQIAKRDDKVLEAVRSLGGRDVRRHDVVCVVGVASSTIDRALISLETRGAIERGRGGVITVIGDPQGKPVSANRLPAVAAQLRSPVGVATGEDEETVGPRDKDDEDDGAELSPAELGQRLIEIAQEQAKTRAKLADLDAEQRAIIDALRRWS